MVSYLDINEFEIKNPKIFFGFLLGSCMFLIIKLCEIQFVNIYNFLTA